MDDATDVFCHWPTNRKLPLRVPGHQISVVAQRQVTLLLVQAAQLGRPLAQQPGYVRQREAPPMSRAPEQRQTCVGSQGHKVIEALTQHPHWACVSDCPAARPQTLTSPWFGSLDKHPLFTFPGELSSQSMIVGRINSRGHEGAVVQRDSSS